MEATYFKKQLRGYNVVLGILKAETEDDFCRNCIGLEGAITKVEKGLKKLKLDLADLAGPEEEKGQITDQIDRLRRQVGSLPLGQEPTCQKTAGLCKIGPDCLPRDGLVALMNQITQ